MFGGITSALAANIGAILGGVLGIAATVLFYEGIAVPLPFVGWVSIIDGRVDRVREEADARCEAQKEASRILAQRADEKNLTLRLQDMQLAILAANERAFGYQQELAQAEREFREDDDEAVAAGTVARCVVGPRAARSLQRRDLPYPDAPARPDQPARP